MAVDLPTNVTDPCVRLRQSSERMATLKRSHQPRATMAFLSIAGWLPGALQYWALNLITSKGSVVLTKIEGAGSRFLAGSRLMPLTYEAFAELELATRSAPVEAPQEATEIKLAAARVTASR